MSKGRNYELIIKATNTPTILENLKIDVVISGYLSRTTTTMIFHNMTDNDTEGELIFPMSENAVMCGYAVDIEGVLVDGVVVEKEKARVTFEKESRKTTEKPSVSIAEHVVGNIFKTRIFPVPKQGKRIIKITYVEQLNVNNNVAVYDLPLKLKHLLIHYFFSITVDLEGNVIPTLATDLEDPRPMHASTGILSEKKNPRLNSRFIEIQEGQNINIRKGLKITIPDFYQNIIIEKDIMGETYFAINDTVPKPPSHLTEAMVNSVGILWDASASRKDNLLRNKEFDVIKELCLQMSKLTIELYVFRNAVDPIQTFKISHGNSDEIINVLSQIIYDGGTSFKGLPVTGKNDWYMLFSDGLTTLSPELSEGLVSPVYVFSSSDQANHNLLKIWGRKSGGDYFKIKNDFSASTVVSQMGKPPFSFVSATFDKSSIELVYPSVPISLSSITNFLISGKIKKFTATSSIIQLNYGYGTRITHQAQFELITTTDLSSGLVTRFWAQRYIDELSLFPEIPGNDEKILQVGRKFSIVTPNTSLIVLEKLDQYLQYEIEPPQNLVHIHEQWHTIMNERKLQNHQKKEEKINDVLSLWKRRVAWWNEDISSPETSEPLFIHCSDFGKGIDLIAHKLAPEWIKFFKEKDSQKALQDLQKFREIEQREIAEMQRKWDQLQQDNLKKLEEEKRKQTEAEQKKLEEKALREKIAREEFEFMLVEEETQKKRQQKKKKKEEETRIRQEQIQYEEYLNEQRQEQQQLDQMKQVDKENRDLSLRQLEEYCTDSLAKLNVLGSSLSYFKKRKIDKMAHETLSWLSYHDSLSADEYKSKQIETEKVFSPIFASLPMDHIPPPEPIGQLIPFSESSLDEPQLLQQEEIFLPLSTHELVRETLKLESGFYSRKKGLLQDDGSTAVDSTRKKRGRHRKITSRSGSQIVLTSERTAQSSSAIVSSPATAVHRAGEDTYVDDDMNNLSVDLDYIPELCLLDVEAEVCEDENDDDEDEEFKVEEPAEGVEEVEECAEYEEVEEVEEGEEVEEVEECAEPEETEIPTQSWDEEMDLSSKRQSRSNLLQKKTTREELTKKKKKRSSNEEERENEINNRYAAMIKSKKKEKKVKKDKKRAAKIPKKVDHSPPAAHRMKNKNARKRRMAAGHSSVPTPTISTSLTSALLPSTSTPAVVVSETKKLNISQLPQLQIQKQGIPILQEQQQQQQGMQQNLQQQLLQLQQQQQQQQQLQEQQQQQQGMQQNLQQQLLQLQHLQLSQQQPQQLSHHHTRRQRESCQPASDPLANLLLTLENGMGGMGSIPEGPGIMRGQLPPPLAIAKSGLPPPLAIAMTGLPSNYPPPLAIAKSGLPSNYSQPLPGIGIGRMGSTLQGFLSVKEIDTVFDKQINILIKTLTGKAYTLICNLQMTILKIKELLAARADIPAIKIDLIYGETVLKNDCTLDFYKIENETELLFANVVDYDDIPITNPDSWKKWHAKQLVEWSAFEEKHFQEGNYFMEKWKRDRLEIKQNTILKQMGSILKEQSKNAFHPEFTKKFSNVTIRFLPKQPFSSEAKSLTGDIYQSYLNSQKSTSRLCTFYFDVANILFDKNDNTLALRVLSNLAELEFDNPQFLRLLSFKLDEQNINFISTTIEILRKVMKLRPEEPHSFLYLSYALIRSAKYMLTRDPFGNRSDLSLIIPSNEDDIDIDKIAKELIIEAIESLNKIILGHWDIRFSQIEVTTVMELNRIVNLAEFYGFQHEILPLVDSRLLAPIYIDLRVIVIWDTDMTDLELHVIEPSGEKCYSFHNKTKSGGMLSRDFTKGYGPEEYLTRNATPGDYKIMIKLFNSFSRYTGTTAQVRIWTHFNNPLEEQERIYTVRLHKDGELHQVAVVTFT